ncbi:MAG: Rha family transcriptional regulator [Lachnospiraceae bacterium]|nr:Rha family transcriptional regulator [Lachnospiraceae bacterium]
MQKIEQTLSSIEVAEMMGKPHANLLRSIRTYEQHFNQLKIDLVEYFQQTSYLDGKGEERKSYNITKKGCEFIAHKMTGIKGTEFTVKYIDRFHDMEQAITEAAEQISQLTTEEIVDWKLNDLHKRLKALEGKQADKPKIGTLHRLTPRKDTWYEKNRNRIWRIRYDKNMELKELYHLILEECSKYYNLDEAEQVYRDQTGHRLAYPIDVVEYFPELQDIANQVLDYFEN